MAAKADSDLVRTQNRHLVLEALRFAGEVPRIELGRRTGLSPATITAISAQLMSEGILREVTVPERANARRGRPSVDLKLNPKCAFVLAIKLSIDRFELALSDYVGKRIAQQTVVVATFNMAREMVAPKAAQIILDFLRSNQIDPKHVRKAGIAVQGAADSNTGRIVWSPAFQVQDIPLAEPVGLATGISCFLANDANMIAEGLMAREQYRYKGTAAVIFMGYGVGMGLVIDGRTYHGATGAAAEFGHMNHIPHGAICRCGTAGCLEAYASDYGILRQAEGLPDNAAPPASAVDPEIMAALEKAARSGDIDALRAYQCAGEAIGFGLARMISLLNPDRIVISGPGLRAYDLIEPAIKSAMEAGVVAALRQGISLETLPMDHDMIITGTIDKLLHDLDRDVFSNARAEV